MQIQGSVALVTRASGEIGQYYIQALQAVLDQVKDRQLEIVPSVQ